MGLFSSDETDVSDHMKADPQGDHVSQKRLRKIDPVLEEGESVHYMTAGSTVDAEGDGAGQSLFGDDRSRKSGTTGYVRTAFTDDRVVIKIPQITGNDQRIVPYNNITSVDVDTGMIKKRISLQTKGHTYHIEVDKPGKEECRDIASFVREKMRELQESQQTANTNEPDPTEQLTRLKDLHDDGVLTDEEFQEKKQSLLDQI